MTKTVPQKLAIKPGDSVFLDGVDEDRLQLVSPLPGDVILPDSPSGAAVLVMFVDDAADFDAKADAHLPYADDARAIWFAYLKGGRSDINRDSIWRRMEDRGWTLTANVSISETWSAVRAKMAT